MGARRADEINVRYWASDRNIGPQKREDFDGIIRVVGLEPLGEYLWGLVLLLRRAHLRAGMQIMRRLLAKATQVDDQHLSVIGYEEFTLPGIDGVTLSAVRVLGRSQQTYQVPPSRLDRIITNLD